MKLAQKTHSKRKWTFKIKCQKYKPPQYPPSTNASWRSTRLIRMGSIKVTEERIVQNEPLGDPGTLLRTVTLPVNQVLEPPAAGANIQDPRYRVGGMTIDEAGGAAGRRAEG